MTGQAGTGQAQSYARKHLCSLTETKTHSVMKSLHYAGEAGNKGAEAPYPTDNLSCSYPYLFYMFAYLFF